MSARFTQYLFKRINPDVVFLTKCNTCSNPPDVLRDPLIINGSSFVSINAQRNRKLIPHENPNQTQIKLYTHKTEFQPVVSEGIGWDGQPIVKRIHAILPEVYGDVSDVFTALNQLPKSMNTINSENIQPKDLISQVQEDCLNVHNRIGPLNENSSLDADNNQETMGSCIKSHDNISLINNSKNVSFTMENISVNSSKTSRPVNKLVKPDLRKSENNHFHKEYSVHVKPGIIRKNSKKRLKKKKTKVCAVKSVKLGVNKVKLFKKKKNKVFGQRKKNQLQNQLVLNQRDCSHYYSNKVLLMENRQLTTDTALSYPRTSMVMNKKDSKTASEKKQGKTSKKKKGKKENVSDDCVCPETVVVKKQKKTKVCGKAAGSGEKKEKKKWKPKMCIVEPIMKYRQKTFVCTSAAQLKGKKKRNLPKCPKPEKKEVPRTEVCPPQIDEELKGKAKKCVKQEEEIKIRQRTKVCKPVIIYGKEEASIKIEKTICAESRVKKTISRHTKVCPPPNKENNKSKTKRN